MRCLWLSAIAFMVLVEVVHPALFSSSNSKPPEPPRSTKNQPQQVSQSRAGRNVQGGQPLKVEEEQDPFTLTVTSVVTRLALRVLFFKVLRAFVQYFVDIMLGVLIG